MAHNQLRAHKTHSVTLANRPTVSLFFPAFSVYLSLIVKQTRTNTLLILPKYQAPGFCFFAGWGNDMVVALTAATTKQQIVFTATLYRLFVVWRCATSPVTLSSPLASCNKQRTMFCFPSPPLSLLLHPFIFPLFDWNSPLGFTSSPCLEIICHAWSSLRLGQSFVLFQSLQSCLHSSVGPSRVGKGCSGANYSDGLCVQWA